MERRDPLRKYHHFRPIHHLRHFANANGAVWVYDVQGKMPVQPLGLSVVGGEKYLYAPEAGEEPKDDSFERWLADHIDGPAAEPIRKLIESGDLSTLAHGERSKLAAYFGVLEMRTPRVRDFLIALFSGELNDEYLEMTLDRGRVKREITERYGVEYSDEELEELIATHHVNVEKDVWLEFMQRNVNIAGKRIFRMGWRMVKAPPNYAYVTNDVGAVKFAGSFDVPRSYKLAFAAERSHWLIPLSSKWAIALDPGETGEPVEARPAWIKTVNKQIAADAYRFVYCQRKSPFVAKWLTSRIPAA